MSSLKDKIESIKNQKPLQNRIIIINQKYFDKYREEVEQNNIKFINLSFKLSKLLKNLDKESREHEAWDILKEWMESPENKSYDVLAFYNIDYVFSPEVATLDPVHNFNYYSRDNQIIILFINARKSGNLLKYSSEGLDDYLEMDISKNEGYVLGWNNED